MLRSKSGVDFCSVFLPLGEREPVDLAFGQRLLEFSDGINREIEVPRRKRHVSDGELYSRHTGKPPGFHSGNLRPICLVRLHFSIIFVLSGTVRTGHLNEGTDKSFPVVLRLICNEALLFEFLKGILISKNFSNCVAFLAAIVFLQMLSIMASGRTSTPFRKLSARKGCQNARISSAPGGQVVYVPSCATQPSFPVFLCS